MEEINCDDVEKEKDNVESSDFADHSHNKPLVLHGTVKRSTCRARRSSKANWTEEEDAILEDAVERYEGKCWKKIAELLPGRTDTQCLHRWGKVIKPDLVKGHWSKEEDDLLVELVGKLGKKWREIEKHLPGRIGKQCRERWFNHLNPEISKAAWTKEEEMILIDVHAGYGNKWSEIAKFLPGRTENSVKNHWNCSLKKKLDNSLSSRLTIVPALDSNKPETGENQSTNCLQEANFDSGQNVKSHFLDYAKYSAPDLSCRDDISYNNIGMDNSSSDYSYTGLWYEPIQMGDLNVFLTTGRFPSTDRYIHQQSRSISPESSRRNTKMSSDLLRRLTSMLKSAAMSYRNVPSIIRKRTLEKDFSTRESLNISGSAWNEHFQMNDPQEIRKTRTW